MADLETLQELVQNLTDDKNEQAARLDYLSENANSFFLIVMAIVIYCKSLLF